MLAFQSFFLAAPPRPSRGCRAEQQAAPFPRRALFRQCARRCVPAAQLQSKSKSPLQLAKDAQHVYGTSKPPWCQPWTILSTGSIVIVASWGLLPDWAAVLSLLISVGVGTWWYVFLIMYPQGTLLDSDH